jgi:hypothetical protein
MVPNLAQKTRRWLLLADVVMMVALLALTEAGGVKDRVPKVALLAGAGCYLLMTAGVLFFMRPPVQDRDSRSVLGRGGPVALSYLPRGVLGLGMLVWAFFER